MRWAAPSTRSPSFDGLELSGTKSSIHCLRRFLSLEPIMVAFVTRSSRPQNMTSLRMASSFILFAQRRGHRTAHRERGSPAREAIQSKGRVKLGAGGRFGAPFCYALSCEAWFPCAVAVLIPKLYCCTGRINPGALPSLLNSDGSVVLPVERPNVTRVLAAASMDDCLYGLAINVGTCVNANISPVDRRFCCFSLALPRRACTEKRAGCQQEALKNESFHRCAEASPNVEATHPLPRAHLGFLN